MYNFRVNILIPACGGRMTTSFGLPGKTLSRTLPNQACFVQWSGGAPLFYLKCFLVFSFSKPDFHILQLPWFQLWKTVAGERRTRYKIILNWDKFSCRGAHNVKFSHVQPAGNNNNAQSVFFQFVLCINPGLRRTSFGLPRKLLPRTLPNQACFVQSSGGTPLFHLKVFWLFSFWKPYFHILQLPWFQLWKTVSRELGTRHKIVLI